MTLTTKIVIISIWTITCLAIGKYLAPEKIKIEKQVVTVEKEVIKLVKIKDKKVDKNTNLNKVIVEEKLLDGTIKKVTTIVSNSNTVSQTDSKVVSDTTKDKTETSSEKKEIQKSSKRTYILGMVGANPIDFNRNMIYTLGITHDLIGPFNIGVFGSSQGNLSFSLGLYF